MIDRRTRCPPMRGLIGQQSFSAGRRPCGMLRQGDAGERCEYEEDDLPGPTRMLVPIRVPAAAVRPSDPGRCLRAREDPRGSAFY